MWDNPRQLNLLALAFAVAAAALAAWGVGTWAVRQPLFALRQVVVDGSLRRADPAYLEAVVREELRGTFFTMRFPEARASLERVPWIKSVALRRQWPDTLRISVVEHEPLARWTEGTLVDTEGQVFAAEFAGDLPQLSGPEGSAPLVAARFRDYGTQLAGRALAIAELRLSSRGGWRLRTTGGQALTIEVGHNDPAERLSRFVAYYARTVGALARTGRRVDYVDLRYGSGFAVRTEGPTEKNTRKTGQGIEAW
ncbi:MAG TPA: cell division protein FtsQ/DivIB [Casimicrobiaceae bacterium]|nr:cell division protein FtsQ/DivIB [Casimicrobiaceae bacterium]